MTLPEQGTKKIIWKWNTAVLPEQEVKSLPESVTLLFCQIKKLKTTWRNCNTVILPKIRERAF